MGIKTTKPDTPNEAQNSHEMPNVFGFGETAGYAPNTEDGVVLYGQPIPSGAGPVRSIMKIAKWEASPDNPTGWAPRGGEKD